MKRKRAMSLSQTRNIRKGQITRCVNYLAYIVNSPGLLQEEQELIDTCKQDLESLITDWETNNANLS